MCRQYQKWGHHKCQKIKHLISTTCNYAWTLILIDKHRYACTYNIHHVNQKYASYYLYTQDHQYLPKKNIFLGFKGLQALSWMYVLVPKNTIKA